MAPAQKNPVSTSVSGRPLVFIPKMPVINVGGSNSAVSTDNKMQALVALLFHLELQLFLKQTAALTHLDNGVIQRIEPLSEFPRPQPQRPASAPRRPSVRDDGK